MCKGREKKQENLNEQKGNICHLYHVKIRNY